MEKKINPQTDLQNLEAPKPFSKRKLFFAWILLGFALLYGVSPIDILPEAFLGPFGLGDDIVVSALAIYNLFKQIKNKRNSESN